MIFRLIVVFLLLLNWRLHVYSQNTNQSRILLDSSKISKKGFLSRIMQLNEFRLEQKRVDSIKAASGIPVKLYIEIVDSSFLKQDKGKNISLGFINEDWPYDHNKTMYAIRFDKDKQTIISIENYNNEFEQLGSHSPKDPLVPKIKQ
jgi:hypothetical protein